MASVLKSDTLSASKTSSLTFPAVARANDNDEVPQHDVRPQDEASAWILRQRAISVSFRRRRARLLRSMLTQLRARRAEGPIRVLDVGGTLPYWHCLGADFLERNEIEITIVNRAASEFRNDGSIRNVSWLVSDARSLDLEDGSFDLVHANSVIEHVGRMPDMAMFAREVRRVARSYYVQTPYFWFPIDPHHYRFPAIHWLPEPVQARLMARLHTGYSPPTGDIMEAAGRVDSRLLLDRRRFRHLFPDATHRFERFLGLPKSMIAFRLEDAAR